jgi:hypothetical protein
MRKIMMAAVGLVMSGGVAWGQSASQTVNLSATVGTACTIAGSANALTGTATNLISTATRTVTTGGPLVLSASPGGVTCSTNATITLTSARGGLTNTTDAGNAASSSTGTFTNKIHYTARAAYSDKEVIIDTSNTWSVTQVSNVSASTTSGAQTNATLGLEINVLPTATNRTLVGGEYSDTLTVTITPTT